MFAKFLVQNNVARNLEDLGYDANYTVAYFSGQKNVVKAMLLTFWEIKQ